MMRTFKSIEEMRGAVGTELGQSEWVTVDQARIDTFAQATGDKYWIHVDVARATLELPDGRTIGHGFLSLSLIPDLSHQIWTLTSLLRGANYGLDKVRFPAPVRVNDRLRLRQHLVAIDPLGEGYKIQFGNVIEIENGVKPACVADTISAIYERKQGV
jgi:acyl dehydratase